MPTMNVKAGSGLGVGLGAGVASGVGTGIVVSVFRTRRPDCAKIAAAQIATSVIATLTLIGFEEYKQRIGSFLSVRTAGPVGRPLCKEIFRHRAAALYYHTFCALAGTARSREP